jgi:hypothetical protein
MQYTCLVPFAVFRVKRAFAAVRAMVQAANVPRVMSAAANIIF